MLNTRNYINSFIEVKADDLETTCYNKEQAEDLIYNLLETVDELKEFVENCKD